MLRNGYADQLATNRMIRTTFPELSLFFCSARVNFKVCLPVPQRGFLASINPRSFAHSTNRTG
jgi:hypothetical protein